MKSSAALRVVSKIAINLSERNIAVFIVPVTSTFDVQSTQDANVNAFNVQATKVGYVNFPALVHMFVRSFKILSSLYNNLGLLLRDAGRVTYSNATGSEGRVLSAFKGTSSVQESRLARRRREVRQTFGRLWRNRKSKKKILSSLYNNLGLLLRDAGRVTYSDATGSEGRVLSAFEGTSSVQES